MKFTIEKTTLLKALDRAKSVTDNKGPMPILAHVRLQADPDKLHGCLHVSATNLFIAVKTTVNCSVDEDGGICLNAKDLHDRLKLMPDGDVKFACADNKATIKASKSPRKFVMHGLPVEEYPTLPEVNSSTAPVTFNDKELSQNIEAAIYAVSTDETRPFINSLLFEERDGKLNLVATDGHRLAVLRNCSSVDQKWLVPLNAVRELARLCYESASNKGDNHAVIFYPETNNLFVTVNGFQFSCKLAEGNFPPFNQIIPSTWEKLIKVNRAKLVESLKALIVSTGDSKGVKFSFSESKLTLSTESVNGTAQDEIECDYTGNDATYGISAAYMIQALEPVNTDNVVLKLSGELDAILIEEDKVKVEGKEEYLSIVMPLRI